MKAQITQLHHCLTIRFLPFLDQYFFWLLLVIFIIAIILMPNTGLVNDFDTFLQWVQYMLDHGFTQAYGLEINNYFPIFNYLLYLWILIYHNYQNIAVHIYDLKFFLVAFDFGSVALAAWLLKKFQKPRYWALLILFNPAFFYNSWVWGQIEALYLFFTLAAIFAALYKHPNWSVVFYVLAFYSKMQAIVFLPGLVLLLAPQYIKHPKQILLAIGSIFLTHLIILFPFIYAGQLTLMYQNVLASVDMFPIISANAYNFWTLLLSGKMSGHPDGVKFFIVSYKLWGILLFCSASALALWPGFLCWLKAPRQVIALDLKFLYSIFLQNALIALIFFYFPTQMHERYLQPAILLFGMVFLFKPNRISGFAYLIISITYFFQLERIIRYLQLSEFAYKWMSSRVMSINFGIVLVLGMYLLYQKRIVKTKKTDSEFN
ncbi:MAG: hypothetical protein WCJ58_07565 [bacterium]